MSSTYNPLNLNPPPFINTSQIVDIFSHESSLVKNEKSHQASGDVLAHVCYMYRQNKKNKICDDIEKMHASMDGVVTVHEDCDVKLADDIRKFYRQKLVLKRLSDPEISDFDQIIEWIVSNPSDSYKLSHIRPMSKLPDFYREDTETRDIIKKYDSLPEDCQTHVSGKITYVGSVYRKTSRGSQMSWFYKTENNHLVKMVTPMRNDDLSYCAWKSISENLGELDIDAKVVRTRIPGELFWAYTIPDARDVKVNFAK